jgi:surface antigen
MSDDRVGNPWLPAARLRSRRAGRRARATRRLITAAGLPAALALSGAIPMIIGQAAPARPAPSTILCTGWHRCDARGYDSYGYGAHQGTMYWRMFPGNNCTNYVAYVESTVYHVAAPRFLLGNGGEWAVTARVHGVLVNHTPSVGAVAVWAGGTAGLVGGSGHVGIVEEVAPRARSIVVSQQDMSLDADGYEWTLIRAGHPADEWQPWPSWFIHFRIPRHADIAYYSARTRVIGLRDSLTSGPVNSTAHLGLPGVIPLVGDWSGSGRDSTGYYNPKYGTFRLFGVRRTGQRNVNFAFGPPGMIPLVGDWKGIGRDGVGYYDPATATFNVRESLTSGRPDESFRFGPPRMIPLAGDWNGGRTDGIGFYDPKTGIFRLRNKLSAGPLYRSFRFGQPHMIPLTGNWLGGSRDHVGYYNPWTGMYYLRNRLSNGPASYVIRFGPKHMIPRAGDWFGG